MLAAAAAAAAAAEAATTIPPQHDAIAQAALHGISGNDIVLVAMARVLREERTPEEMEAGGMTFYRQPEPYQLEYRTRHLIDGSIIDCDQRIGLVAGYMKDEVRMVGQLMLSGLHLRLSPPNQSRINNRN